MSTSCFDESLCITSPGDLRDAFRPENNNGLPSRGRFVADGFGVRRFPVMYDDFVLIGPASDPARIKGMTDVVEALRKIKETNSPFVSRGDQSGTHLAELELWKRADIDIERTAGPWYLSIGQGMGAALNTAAGRSAYVLSDRGTWISFKNKADLAVLAEGDSRLFNQYGVILVNPAKHPHIKVKEGQAFIDWLLSAQGQSAIGEFNVDGQQLFHPNAERR